MSRRDESHTTSCKTRRVMILTGVRLFREGLLALLAAREDIEVVAAVSTVDEGIAGVAAFEPDVLLADSKVVRNSNLVAQCMLAREATKIVAFAVTEDDDTEILACAEAGVAGFAIRDASVEELIAILDASLCGELVCSPRIAGLIVRRCSRLAALLPNTHIPTALTRRECEIVELVAAGLSNKEIARRLRIESATVKNHVHNLLEKLNVRRRGEAAALVHSHATLGTEALKN